MLYLFSDLEHFSDENLAHALQIMPARRREHILRFRKKEDQKRSAIGYLLLIYGLRQEYGITSLPHYIISQHQKPYLAGKNMPYFSISHSGSYVGCAIHTSEIGLDIQKIVPVKPSLIKRICTEQEFHQVCPHDNTAETYDASAFFRIWSAKESASKLLGTGITGEFRDIFSLHPEIHTTTMLSQDQEYCISVSI